MRACTGARVSVSASDTYAATAAPHYRRWLGSYSLRARLPAQARSLPGAAGRVGRGIPAPHGSPKYSERSRTVSALGSRREGRAALAGLQRLARSLDIVGLAGALALSL